MCTSVLCIVCWLMRQQKRERDSKSKKEGRFLSDNTTHGKREREREEENRTGSFSFTQKEQLLPALVCFISLHVTLSSFVEKLFTPIESKFTHSLIHSLSTTFTLTLTLTLTLHTFDSTCFLFSLSLCVCLV
jgi:hypothetical protein